MDLTAQQALGMSFPSLLACDNFDEEGKGLPGQAALCGGGTVWSPHGCGVSPGPGPLPRPTGVCVCVRVRTAPS